MAQVNNKKELLSGLQDGLYYPEEYRQESKPHQFKPHTSASMIITPVQAKKNNNHKNASPVTPDTPITQIEHKQTEQESDNTDANSTTISSCSEFMRWIRNEGEYNQTPDPQAEVKLTFINFPCVYAFICNESIQKKKIIQRKKQKAINTRQANIFLRRIWGIGSKLLFSPTPGTWVPAQISHIVSFDTIRIELMIVGQVFQKEVIRHHTSIKPFPEEIEKYLEYGAEYFLPSNAL